MLKAGNGRTSSRLVGLHFAGSDDLSGAEQALACYASSVREVLGFSLSAGTAAEAAAGQAATRGYDPDFLEHPVPVPQLSDAHREDAVEVDGDVLVPYTHFSLVQSQGRRFARFVAWNIDGGRMLRLDRSGIDFREDRRVPSESQAGEDLYARNDLDRGHIARRADLVWGERAEAQRANEDSFFFTNIAPQMDVFNQSGRGGVWGELENSLFEQAQVQDLRVSVVGGPIFTDSDREYRGFRIPRAFFKAVYYVSDGELQVRSFILAQDLDSLESLDLREFETHRVSLDELSECTGLTFAPAGEGNADARAQSLEERVVRSTADIDW
jgi:endonuclease G